MRLLANLITRTGDFLLKLSDSARKAIVFGLLLLLGGGAIYKLAVSLDSLNKPQPKATPDQLIKPMEKLFRQTRSTVGSYQQAKRHDMHQLDSLAKIYSTK